MAKRTTARTHNSRRYRSGLEKEAAAFLTSRQKELKYEQLKIEWEDLRYRKYTPDFELDNGIIVETKGIFDNETPDQPPFFCKLHLESSSKTVSPSLGNGRPSPPEQ